jgi:hypothetical protein
VRTTLGNSTRSSVSKPLALDANRRSIGAHQIVAAERNARAAAKVKFGKVTMKVLLAAVLIGALHPPLENRVVALDRVCADNALTLADVLIVGARPCHGWQRKSGRICTNSPHRSSLGYRDVRWHG